jgi:hypothetical protein
VDHPLFISSFMHTLPTSFGDGLDSFIFGTGYGLAYLAATGYSIHSICTYLSIYLSIYLSLPTSSLISFRTLVNSALLSPDQKCGWMLSLVQIGEPSSRTFLYSLVIFELPGAYGRATAYFADARRLSEPTIGYIVRKSTYLRLPF